MRKRGLVVLLPLIACTHAASDPQPVKPAISCTETIDVDGDGNGECVVTSCYSSNCDVVIYRREPSGMRRIAEMTASVIASSPRCVDRPPSGEFCRLEADVHMIHGELLPTYWMYVRDHYVENGHGPLIPGPSDQGP
jgi:hypothetical protein